MTWLPLSFHTFHQCGVELGTCATAALQPLWTPLVLEHSVTSVGIPKGDRKPSYPVISWIARPVSIPIQWCKANNYMENAACPQQSACSYFQPWCKTNINIHELLNNGFTFSGYLAATRSSHVDSRCHWTLQCDQASCRLNLDNLFPLKHITRRRLAGERKTRPSSSSEYGSRKK